MMGGLTFMVNDKMCLGVLNNELMARIDPDIYEIALQRKGCREMDFTKKPIRSFVFVNSEGTGNLANLAYWVNLALEFNKKTKVSKKRKK
jgi:TfoX/Sxy family transcriptional regulator of competence genes